MSQQPSPLGGRTLYPQGRSWVRVRVMHEEGPTPGLPEAAEVLAGHPDAGKQRTRDEGRQVTKAQHSTLPGPSSFL